jgi:hypothetical protein
MPDEHGDTKAEPTETPLHAYKEGREDDVEGDAAEKPRDEGTHEEGPDEQGPGAESEDAGGEENQ